MVKPADITWEVLPDAREAIRSALASLDEQEAKKNRSALKQYLCDYFNAEHHCSAKQGKSISPHGGSNNGGKRLKVRWLLPGSGKSGGLRIGVVCFCEVRRVVISCVFPRKDSPSNQDFEDGYEQVWP